MIEIDFTDEELAELAKVAYQLHTKAINENQAGRLHFIGNCVCSAPTIQWQTKLCILYGKILKIST